ncbi:hypothetical protein PF010_g14989 [Phytophthora fragariae]|uniref:CCHC-type domain-containing protein n=1 Tax=Phytophthora fragariae TaxID=53985 RepID=A0A6G0KW02_9STRA|nr:hypothetical protein PF010_g14989 [Phytophthora fragariae]
MMSLLADLETILDQFNLTELDFEHEQHRIVGYLANALAPASSRLGSALLKLRQHLTQRRNHTNLVSPVGVIREDKMLVLAEVGAKARVATVVLMVAEKAAINKMVWDQEIPVAPVAAIHDPRSARGACLKCNSADHQVRDCPRCQTGKTA